MKARLLAYWRDSDRISVILAVVFAIGSPVMLFTGDHERAWYYLLLAIAWQAVASARVERNRARRLAPNQAIVTAAIEPSSDVRQFARSVSEIRIALLNEGMTSERARQTLMDIFEANARGQK